MTQPDLITAADAADVLGVSVATVHRFEKDGILPVAFKVDGLRGPKLFDRRKVDDLAASRSEGVGA